MKNSMLRKNILFFGIRQLKISVCVPHDSDKFIPAKVSGAKKESQYIFLGLFTFVFKKKGFQSTLANIGG